MMAASKKMLDQEPSEIEMLLPLHAAGTLNARDARRVEEALAGDPELARQYAVIREEYAETIRPQREPGCAVRARHAEAVRRDRWQSPCASHRCRSASPPGYREFFASLSPRTLAWSASVGARGAAVAGRRDRRGADEEPDGFVPDRVAEHERAVVGAHHPRSRRSARRRARWCGLRRKPASPTSPHCSTTIRPRSSMAPRAACSGCSSAKGDGQGRSRKPDEQAARREDRQPRGGNAVSRSSRARQAEVPWFMMA